MSDEDDKKLKRKPLTRSRRLGSRRRRGQEADEEGSGGEEAAESTEAAEEGAGEPEATRAVPAAAKIPAAPVSSGQPDISESSPPAGEQWAKRIGSARRFLTEFSGFVHGLGRTAQVQGQTFGREVVKPFSQALFEAALCLLMFFSTAAFGVVFGRYVKTATAPSPQTVTFQNQVVRPGQQLDESLFSQGFNTVEIQQQAHRVLEDYLRALQEGNYQRAYAHLSREWQAELPFAAFERGYQATPVLSYRVGRAENINDRQIKMRTQFQVREGEREVGYLANYVVVLSGDGWKLDGGQNERVD